MVLVSIRVFVARLLYKVVFGTFNGGVDGKFTGANGYLTRFLLLFLS